MVTACRSAMAATSDLSLAGEWRFRLDPEDAGVKGRMFAEDLPDRINLPGSLQEQGYGDSPSAATKWTSRIGGELLAQEKYVAYQKSADFKTPFWLTPRRHYVGVAWYQRDVIVPAEWAEKRIVLQLERPHWETSVWVDDQPIGTRDSLGTPHEYDLTATITPGLHRLTVRVDNRVKVDVGLDAHSISDQTQSNWNGIAGDLKLVAREKVWIDDVQVYPDAAARKVRVSVAIGNVTGQAGTGTLTTTATSANSPKAQPAPATVVPIEWSTDGGAKAEFDFDLGSDAELWDEFSPALYRLDLRLNVADAIARSDSRTVTFGLRDLGIAGTQFTINGRRIFLRGTLECCIFPLTGYPPTDVESWKRIMRVARAHGLNHLRFHSYCPPESAFAAADEMGFYVQAEASCWTQFGKGEAVDRWVTEEGDRMLRAYGNHPSFIVMAPSNEPNQKDDNHFLGQLVQRWAKADPRRKYVAGSGWPKLPENDLHIIIPPRMAEGGMFDRAVGTDFDYHDIISAEKVPVVSHEIGQWCAYPNFEEIPKYTGVLQAGNLDIFRDFLRKSGMEGQAKDFLTASGKFQALLYKEEIEAALRTAGMGGFQLLDLQDFPGQGMAPVGVLDAFWDSKGYITPEAYSRFCADTVPLARFQSRVLRNTETFEARIEAAHFGPTDLTSVRADWRIRDANAKVLGEGVLSTRTLATGSVSELGALRLPLADVADPAKLNLEVSLTSDGLASGIANDWDFWVYPAGVATAPPTGVRVVKALDKDALAFLHSGGRVLLLPDPSGIGGDTRGSFRPIFWNRVTFAEAKDHTLGVLCDPTHPALARFPTASHSDWQWRELQQNCKPMVLDTLPKDMKPVVQVIDDWTVCRKLGLLIEARVGKGKLLVCSIDLDRDLEKRPVARALRHSLLDYVGSDRFNPAVGISPDQVRAVLAKP